MWPWVHLTDHLAPNKLFPMRHTGNKCSREEAGWSPGRWICDNWVETLHYIKRIQGTLWQVFRVNCLWIDNGQLSINILVELLFELDDAWSSSPKPSFWSPYEKITLARNVLCSSFTRAVLQNCVVCSPISRAFILFYLSWSPYEEDGLAKNVLCSPISRAGSAQQPRHGQG